jgi:hypothetical protein
MGIEGCKTFTECTLLPCFKECVTIFGCSIPCVPVLLQQMKRLCQHNYLSTFDNVIIIDFIIIIIFF